MMARCVRQAHVVRQFLMATPCSESCMRKVVRSMPANSAACLEEGRFSSNSVTAIARRTSRSNSAGVF